MATRVARVLSSVRASTSLPAAARSSLSSGAGPGPAPREPAAYPAYRRRVQLVGSVRRQLAGARARVRGGLWSVGQCALAAGFAWYVAGLFGHARPFFACVAAVVCLGTRAAQRLRRVGELAVGVTVGVGIGDLLARQIGVGPWQIGLVVGVALMVALALDGGPLLVAQSGLQAVFVVALPRTPGSDLARWEDALVGSAVALLVAALLPADPWRSAVREAERSLRELAAAARACARAIRDDDAGAAADALARARGTQTALDGWADALVTGRDITRLSPLRRDRGGTHVLQTELQAGVDRATRNLRVLTRRVLFALETGEHLPPQIAEEIDRFAGATEAMVEHRGPPPELLDLAAELDPEALHVSGLNAAVVVAQLRSAVVDLLVGLGISPDRAREALPPLS